VDRFDVYILLLVYQWRLQTPDGLKAPSFDMLKKLSQSASKGRSKTYRKWHFWRRCWRETPWQIDTKFGMGDYVGDATQYPKRHVNRFRRL